MASGAWKGRMNVVASFDSLNEIQHNKAIRKRQAVGL
jgi:hypothetical protein